MLHYPHHTAWYPGDGDSDAIVFDIIGDSVVIAICLAYLQLELVGMPDSLSMIDRETLGKKERKTHD